MVLFDIISHTYLFLNWYAKWRQGFADNHFGLLGSFSEMLIILELRELL